MTGNKETQNWATLKTHKPTKLILVFGQIKLMPPTKQMVALTCNKQNKAFLVCP